MTVSELHRHAPSLRVNPISDWPGELVLSPHNGQYWTQWFRGTLRTAPCPLPTAPCPTPAHSCPLANAIILNDLMPMM